MTLRRPYVALASRRPRFRRREVLGVSEAPGLLQGSDRGIAPRNTQVPLRDRKLGG